MSLQRSQHLLSQLDLSRDLIDAVTAAQERLQEREKTRKRERERKKRSRAKSRIGEERKYRGARKEGYANNKRKNQKVEEEREGMNKASEGFKGRGKEGEIHVHKVYFL